MDSSLQMFSKNLIIVSLITITLTFGLSYIIPENLISNSWPFLVVFFFAISLFVHRYLLKKAIGQHTKFVNAFLLTTTVKLLLFLAIIVIYVLLNRDDAVGFILTFFTYYLIYTSFEIVSILKYLRNVQN
jgi:L-asparagine transporter-like permease